LRYLETAVILKKVLKHRDRAEAVRPFHYPIAAIAEVVVNFVYQRGYEQREPVEIRLKPDGIEIVSCPGRTPPFATNH